MRDWLKARIKDAVTLEISTEITPVRGAEDGETPHPAAQAAIRTRTDLLGGDLRHERSAILTHGPLAERIARIHAADTETSATIRARIGQMVQRFREATRRLDAAEQPAEAAEGEQGETP